MKQNGIVLGWTVGLGILLLGCSSETPGGPGSGGTGGTLGGGGASGGTAGNAGQGRKYGIILADNGSNWYISGETNQGWASYTDGLVSGLGKVHGSDFEVVDTGTVSTAGL